MPTPNLGYGEASPATLDQVNIWMRSTPWYQQLLKSWGQDPNNVHLNDSQKQQIVRAAQANGVIVDEGKQEVDNSGNFKNQGHALRNTLLVAGIAGAAIATMGAAGVFAGGAGAASAGAGAASAVPAGSLASTAIGSGLAPAIAGGTGLTAAGTAAAVSAPVASAAASAIPWGSVISGGTNLFGNLFGAHQKASSAKEAAQIQSDAAKYAADKQDAANARALAYQEQQAAIDRATAETNRFANYGQWAARENRLGSLQEIAGFGPRAIPAYVPLNGAPSIGASAASAPSGDLPATPSSLDAAVAAANKLAYGGQPKITLGGDTDWASIWAKDPDYAFKRMLGWQAGPQDAPISGPFAGKASTTPKGAISQPYQGSSMVPGSLAAYAQPQVLTPALQAPFYPPGSLAAYAGY